MKRRDIPMLKHFSSYAAISILIISLISCSVDGLFNSSDFRNRLTFGTGIDSADPYQLTGETGSFSNTRRPIYWRLESEDDMEGSAVIIELEKLDNGDYPRPFRFRFDNPQSHDHIMVANFYWELTGQYMATAILENGNKAIASEELSVNQ
jgi:hypothetical protein